MGGGARMTALDGGPQWHAAGTRAWTPVQPPGGFETWIGNYYDKMLLA